MGLKVQIHKAADAEMEGDDGKAADEGPASVDEDDEAKQLDEQPSTKDEASDVWILQKKGGRVLKPLRRQGEVGVEVGVVGLEELDREEGCFGNPEAIGVHDLHQSADDVTGGDDGEGGKNDLPMALKIGAEGDSKVEPFSISSWPSVNDELREAHQRDELPAVIDRALGIDQGANGGGEKNGGQKSQGGKKADDVEHEKSDDAVLNIRPRRVMAEPGEIEKPGEAIGEFLLGVRSGLPFDVHECERSKSGAHDEHFEGAELEGQRSPPFGLRGGGVTHEAGRVYSASFSERESSAATPALNVRT